jgi:hypothetical protein
MIVSSGPGQRRFRFRQAERRALRVEKIEPPGALV